MTIKTMVLSCLLIIISNSCSEKEIEIHVLAEGKFVRYNQFLDSAYNEKQYFLFNKNREYEFYNNWNDAVIKEYKRGTWRTLLDNSGQNILELQTVYRITIDGMGDTNTLIKNTYTERFDFKVMDSTYIIFLSTQFSLGLGGGDAEYRIMK